MAGASAVGIGSAVYYDGVEVFGKINKEMEAWLKKHKLTYEKIIGKAHVT